MGKAESKPCHPFMTNPDLLTVVTLSDSCVQRLPLDIDDNPLEKENREQNIDNFWRDRLACLENAYLETLGISEKHFANVERQVHNMNPVKRQLACPNNIENLTNCYIVNVEEPLNCSPLIKKLTICIDAQAREVTKKNHLEYLRQLRKAQQRAHCGPK